MPLIMRKMGKDQHGLYRHPPASGLGCGGRSVPASSFCVPALSNLRRQIISRCRLNNAYKVGAFLTDL